MNQQDIFNRANQQCELCASKQNLSLYQVPHSESHPTNCTVLLCEQCLQEIIKLSQDVTSTDFNHWRCLNESMWSGHPEVQILAWRLLNQLATQEAWAQDLLEQLYLDEELLAWAQAGQSLTQGQDGSGKSIISKDSNGNQLYDGDNVTLIKDLEVKGAGFTAKRGTLVKKITLTDNPEQIDCKVNGVAIVLLTKYLKKV